MPLEPLHFSALKSVARSLLHYKYDTENERNQSKAMRLGSALDAMIFGTSEVHAFDGTRRGKEWDAFNAAHAGSICLNLAESVIVRGMAESLRRHRYGMELLLEGEQQRLIEWTIAGRACAGTPDTFTNRRVVELKTCRSSDPRRFVWDAIRMGYPAQLAWYQNGLVSSGRASPKEAYIVAVESTPPHPVTVFELTDEAIDQGNRTWRAWFEQLRVAEESDEWPAYAQGTVPFDVPEASDGMTLRIGGEEVEIE